MIAAFKSFEGVFKAGTGFADSRYPVILEDARAACGLQRITLQVQVLIDGAYTRISDRNQGIKHLLLMADISAQHDFEGLLSIDKMGPLCQSSGQQNSCRRLGL